MAKQLETTVTNEMEETQVTVPASLDKTLSAMEDGGFEILKTISKTRYKACVKVKRNDKVLVLSLKTDPLSGSSVDWERLMPAE